MAYNTKEIMKAAWEHTKITMKVMGYWPSEIRKVFARCLKSAWKNAKKAAGELVLSAKEIGFQIMRLECKDTLQTSDFKKLDALRVSQREAWALEAAETKVAA